MFPPGFKLPDEATQRMAEDALRRLRAWPAKILGLLKSGMLHDMTYEATAMWGFHDRLDEIERELSADDPPAPEGQAWLDGKRRQRADPGVGP